MRKKKKAFTLIEILIVLVVIGALMMVLLPGMITRAKDANANKTTISSELDKSYKEIGTFPLKKGE